MLNNITSSNKLIVQSIVSACVAFGIKRVVICPGSRNAPFSIAFDNHPTIQTFVVHDERSAAFFALGMIDELNEPVALVCTSGSAIQNFSPAVSEAFYRELPLIVLSADRPKAWVDQGDGQTIRQENVLKDHVNYFLDLTDDQTSEEYQWFAKRELNTAFLHALNDWKAPIHINVGLHEPLYDTSEISVNPFEKREEVSFNSMFQAETQEKIKNSLSSKILVLCGQMTQNNQLQELITRFSFNSNVAVLVENTSNITHSNFVHCVDRAVNRILDDKIADFKPDILITLGGAVVSKKIKSFLRKHSPKQHWKIGHSFPYMDTYQCVTHVFKMHPVEFFHQTNALEYPKNTINYGALWQQKDILAKDKANELFDQLPHSDLRVFDLLFQYISTNSVLHMANSSVVRYCQLFDPIGGIEYRGNRGTSGIDGSSSTAVGASVANPNKLHVLITGDVSFFYDSNALWNSYLGENLHIILLNNSGGGIFRIIPGPSTSPQRDTYFEATHSTDAKGICESFSINYQSADSLVDTQSIFADFFTPSTNGRPKLVEIKTPREENSTVLDAYFSYLKS